MKLLCSFIVLALNILDVCQSKFFIEPQEVIDKNHAPSIHKMVFELTPLINRWPNLVTIKSSLVYKDGYHIFSRWGQQIYDDHPKIAYLLEKLKTDGSGYESAIECKGYTACQTTAPQFWREHSSKLKFQNVPIRDVIYMFNITESVFCTLSIRARFDFDTKDGKHHSVHAVMDDGVKRRLIAASGVKVNDVMYDINYGGVVDVDAEIKLELVVIHHISVLDVLSKFHVRITDTENNGVECRLEHILETSATCIMKTWLSVTCPSRSLLFAKNLEYGLKGGTSFVLRLLGAGVARFTLKSSQSSAESFYLSTEVVPYLVGEPKHVVIKNRLLPTQTELRTTNIVETISYQSYWCGTAAAGDCGGALLIDCKDGKCPPSYLLLDTPTQVLQRELDIQHSNGVLKSVSYSYGMNEYFFCQMDYQEKFMYKHNGDHQKVNRMRAESKKQWVDVAGINVNNRKYDTYHEGAVSVSSDAKVELVVIHHKSVENILHKFNVNITDVKDTHAQCKILGMEDYGTPGECIKMSLIKVECPRHKLEFAKKIEYGKIGGRLIELRLLGTRTARFTMEQRRQSKKKFRISTEVIPYLTEVPKIVLIKSSMLPTQSSLTAADVASSLQYISYNVCRKEDRCKLRSLECNVLGCLSHRADIPTKGFGYIEITHESASVSYIIDESDFCENHQMQQFIYDHEGKQQLISAMTDHTRRLDAAVTGVEIDGQKYEIGYAGTVAVAHEVKMKLFVMYDKFFKSARSRQGLESGFSVNVVDVHNNVVECELSAVEVKESGQCIKMSAIKVQCPGRSFMSAKKLEYGVKGKKLAELLLQSKFPTDKSAEKTPDENEAPTNKQSGTPTAQSKSKSAEKNEEEDKKPNSSSADTNN